MKPLLITALLVLFTANSFAAERAMSLTSLEYPPYIMTKADGTVTGMATEIVQTIFKEMGRDSSVSVNAWPRSLKMVKDGAADAIFTAYKNDERVKFMDYSKEVLMQQEVVLFVRSDSDIAFSGDLAEIKDKSIGVIRGISYAATFDNAKKAGDFPNLVESTSLGQSAKKFLGGRFDILISNKYTALSMFKDMGAVDKVKVLEVPVQSVPSYIAFSKANDLSSVRDQFDTIIARMKSDGSYQAIIDKYSK